MIYLAIYLYLMGATVVWWFARSRTAPISGKVLCVIGWPVIIPIAALWG